MFKLPEQLTIYHKLPYLLGMPTDAENDLAALEKRRRDISHQHIWDNAMTRGSRPRPPDTSELDAQIAVAREKAGKMFWQRTREQVWRTLRMPAERHRRYVEDALTEGKQVPAEVLKDYPDLCPAAGGAYFYEGA